MVIDTSAIVAILLHEHDAKAYAQAIASAGAKNISAVTRVELAFVIEARKGAEGRYILETLLAESDVNIVAVTAEQAELAIDGFRKFGKGRHPAGLNIGDCFSYALSRALDEPLLFKGADFSETDVLQAKL